MVIRAALQADSPPDAEGGVTADGLGARQARALLRQREDLKCDPEALTFVAHGTTRAEECRFAGDDQILAVSRDGLPFTALASSSRDQSADVVFIAARLVRLPRRPLTPADGLTCLVSPWNWPVLRAVYRLPDGRPQLQLLFRADPQLLDPGEEVPPSRRDLPDVRALAHDEMVEAFEHDPFSPGPWCGG